MTITELIIQKIKLPLIVKKAHGSSPEVSNIAFIEALLNTDTSKKAALYLSVGEQTLNRILARELIPVFGKLNGGNETWKYVLLKSISYKECHRCNTIKPYSKFGLDKHTSDGKFRVCKYCRSFDNASLYQNRKLRIPAWHNLEKDLIAEFYDNCPEGYHVDHIIPLQGELVSGLHTLSNLQYLLAEDNIKKGNTYYESGVKVAAIDLKSIA
jgi:hypothetical protein